MGSKFKIYISCPMSVPQSTIDNYAKIILKLGADVDFWTRGTNYNTLALDSADAVVVLLEGNKWKQSLESIPSGTRSEIASAYARSIPIYIGYRNGNYENDIYESQDINNGWFEGLEGTYNNLLKRILKWKEATSGKTYAERKVELVQSERERNEKAREEKRHDDHRQYLKAKGFDPFGQPVVDAGGRLAPCHSKSERLGQFTDIPLSPGIIESLKNATPPPIRSQWHDYYMNMIARAKKSEDTTAIEEFLNTPNVYHEAQLTKRVEELKAKYLMGIDPIEPRGGISKADKPTVMDHLSFVLGVKPIVYGTPGPDLSGFKDKFGVPALSNDTFVEHLRGMVKAPAPKRWEAPKSSVMDKLKSKNG